jgi:5-methylcytosine-specific restriction endonuclease McrA
MPRVICECCSKEFNKYPSQIRKTKANFCSQSCAAKMNNRKFPKRCMEGKCDSCGESVPSSKKFCKICKQMGSLGQKTKGEVSAKSKFRGCISIRQHARAIAKINGLLNTSCANCGYGYHTQICHIKPIKLFADSALVSEINDKSNLIQLCPNCHWELDHPK